MSTNVVTMDNEIEKEIEKANEGRCESRIAKKGYFITFGNKKGRCYLEFRCDKKAIADNLCPNCIKKTSTCRTQDTRTFDHGRVWEPITEKSQIYGGPWYYENIEKNSDPISDDIQIAIQHQKEARKGFPQLYDMDIYIKPSKGVKSVNDKENVKEEELDKSKRSNVSTETTKRTRSKKEEESPKNSKSRKRGAAASTTTTIKQTEFTTLPVRMPDHVMIYPIYVETIEEPVEIDEVECIDVSIMEFNDDIYYINTKNNSVYEYMKHGGIGEYLGIYENDEITLMEEVEVDED